MEILRVEELCKTYGSGSGAVKALDNVSFSVEKGEILAIIGPSGSGKSTLLHIIAGMIRPTSGRVMIDGTDLSLRTDDELAVFRRRQIGFVYQFFNLIPSLSVKENIALPVRLDGRKPNASHLDELLEALGISDKKDDIPSQLSGGQQQRVGIARALINAPMLVLADEPTGNLDSKTSQEVIELLRESNRRYDQTVIIITHDENVALQADRILYIDDGRLKSCDE